MPEERKIRLMLDVHPRIWGGVETFTVRLVKHLDGRRFKSHVYTSARGIAQTELARASVAATARPPAATDEIAFIRSLLTKLAIDVVQAQHLNSSLALAAKSLGTPVVWLMGGHIDEILKGARPAAKTTALNLVGLLADHIVCPSRFLAAQFTGRSEAVPVTTIHNGVDVDRIRREAGARRRGPRKQFIVGMIAHLLPQKRHADLLMAARRVKKFHPNAKFRIFGGPYPGRNASYPSHLWKITARLGLRNDLSIEQRNAGKFRRYAESDILVFPGINEGCSNAILEAMALGLPVIAADSGGNPELIEDGRSGLLVTPKKPARLADAILRLAGDPDLRRRLGAAALERARGAFDISHSAARYARIYEAVVRSGLRRK